MEYTIPIDSSKYLATSASWDGRFPERTAFLDKSSAVCTEYNVSFCLSLDYHY
jgi:hypothetical protein